MEAELDEGNARVFDELQELVALEVKDILATSRREGFGQRDVIKALERALQAEIRALAAGAPVESAVAATPRDGQES